MSGIQILAAVFALGMMYQTFFNFKRRDLTLGGLGFWEVLWVGLLAVTLFPSVFQRVIGVIHVARLLDLVTIAGILILTALTYYLQVNLRRLQRSLETLVRELALRDLPPEVGPR